VISRPLRPGQVVATPSRPTIPRLPATPLRCAVLASAAPDLLADFTQTEGALSKVNIFRRGPRSHRRPRYRYQGCLAAVHADATGRILTAATHPDD